MRRVLVLALLSAGCFGEEVTPFPPGLEPLAENTAEPPPPEGGDPTPERISFARLRAPAGALAVHARAYVDADVASVWAALRTPDVVANRRRFSEWSVTHDVEPEYDYSFALHAIIRDIITVEYDLTWRHGLVEGTAEEPTLVAVRWQKTAGSTVVRELSGSIVVREVDPGVTTELDIVEHLNATGGNYEGIEQYLTDMFDATVAVAHGQPIPPL